MNPCLTTALAFVFLGAAACSTTSDRDYGYYPSAPPPAYAPEPAPYAYNRPAAYRDADCDIRVRNTRQGVEITPVAFGRGAISGDYDLTISKSGASGSSDVTQGGPFRARAGEKVSLSATEVSLGRRDHYRAVLKLYDGRREICRTEVRS